MMHNPKNKIPGGAKWHSKENRIKLRELLLRCFHLALVIAFSLPATVFHQRALQVVTLSPNPLELHTGRRHLDEFVFHTL